MFFLNRKIKKLLRQYPYLAIETFSSVSKGVETHAARLFGEFKNERYPSYNAPHWSYSYKSIKEALSIAVTEFIKEKNGTSKNNK
jgi:hypothetical protein